MFSHVGLWHSLVAHGHATVVRVDKAGGHTHVHSQELVLVVVEAIHACRHHGAVEAAHGIWIHAVRIHHCERRSSAIVGGAYVLYMR